MSYLSIVQYVCMFIAFYFCDHTRLVGVVEVLQTQSSDMCIGCVSIYLTDMNLMKEILLQPYTIMIIISIHAICVLCCFHDF